jgi:predicted HAD superfamily Cof-like phosphohydrolase
MADEPQPLSGAVAAVSEWLTAAGLAVRERPTVAVGAREREMACALIEEEAAEFRMAAESDDLIEIADAVADLLWVVIEAGLTYGIPIEEVFAEVRRSNWTKLQGPEPTLNEAGKIVAGPGFSPPNIGPILKRHDADTTTAKS